MKVRLQIKAGEGGDGNAAAPRTAGRDGREGGDWTAGTREGVKENEPTDNPICSTEPVMPGCGSTCF